MNDADINSIAHSLLKSPGFVGAMENAIRQLPEVVADRTAAMEGRLHAAEYASAIALLNLAALSLLVEECGVAPATVEDRVKKMFAATGIPTPGLGPDPKKIMGHANMFLKILSEGYAAPQSHGKARPSLSVVRNFGGEG